MGALVKLQSRFPQIIASLPLKVGTATKLSARLVEERAKELAPVGHSATDPHPGRLKEEIYSEDRGGMSPDSAAWAVVSGAKDDYGTPYGHMVEFGTVHAAAHPYLIPAYEQMREEGLAIHRAALQKL